MRKILHLIFAVILITPGSTFTKQRTIKSEDFYFIKQISDCSISPNGKTIAYVLQKVDRENNRYISNIWIIASTGGAPKQLTTSLARDISPQWSPDSRYIAFVSNRSGTNQIWIIPINGGEAWALTNLTTEAYSPAWSPDATRIAFLSRVGNDKKNRQHKNITIIDNKEYATDVTVIHNLKYRSHTKYFDDKFSHIFIVPANGGNINQLTTGKYHDSAPAWSPNSKFIAFASNRHGDFHFDDNSDIYLVSSNGGSVKRVTTGPGPEHSPVWSPTGKYISYIGKSKPNNYSLQNELWTINIKTKEITNLTANFNRSPYNAQWSSNNKKIYFLAADYGNIHLFSASINNKETKKILRGKRQLKTFHISTHKKIVFIATENTNPADLFIANLSGKQEKQLTRINKNFLSTLNLSEPQELFFTSFDNTKIHGWIMKPANFSKTRKYPLIIEIHGGPHSFFGNSWFQEFQILAANGFVVFYCNPRLSTSYGQQLSTLGTGMWGQGDYEDIMAGVNHILKLGYLDSTNMGITGGSYGGYLTNWIIGHTNRFKAAVTQRSLSDLVSFYGTTDIQSFIEFEFGLPWDNFNKLYKHSPITYAKNIRTPLLIIHGELDYRVPICQAEELFTILKRNNCNVEFIRYPDEGHELSRSGQPVHRVDRYNRIVDWFNKYLAK